MLEKLSQIFKNVKASEIKDHSIVLSALVKSGIIIDLFSFCSV